MARKKKTDHVVMRNGHPFCLHCGQKYLINLPAPIDVAVGAMEGFIKAHKNCEPIWQEPTIDPSASVTERLLFWYENGHRGISSETIASKLVRRKGEMIIIPHIKFLPTKEWHHPCDPSDFWRCHKLLELIPEFKKEMYRMRKVSPVWNRLVDNWDELTKLVEEDNPSMYSRMKEIIGDAA